MRVVQQNRRKTKLIEPVTSTAPPPFWIEMTRGTWPLVFVRYGLHTSLNVMSLIFMPLYRTLHHVCLRSFIQLQSRLYSSIQPYTELYNIVQPYPGFYRQTQPYTALHIPSQPYQPYTAYTVLYITYAALYQSIQAYTTPYSPIPVHQPYTTTTTTTTTKTSILFTHKCIIFKNAVIDFKWVLTTWNNHRG